MLHVHVRDPATGQGSLDFDQFNYGDIPITSPNVRFRGFSRQSGGTES
jgi:hypothetical protein